MTRKRKSQSLLFFDPALLGGKRTKKGKGTPWNYKPPEFAFGASKKKGGGNPLNFKLSEFALGGKRRKRGKKGPGLFSFFAPRKPQRPPRGREVGAEYISPPGAGPAGRYIDLGTDYALPDDSNLTPEPLRLDDISAARKRPGDVYAYEDIINTPLPEEDIATVQEHPDVAAAAMRLLGFKETTTRDIADAADVAVPNGSFIAPDDIQRETAAEQNNPLSAILSGIDWLLGARHVSVEEEEVAAFNTIMRASHIDDSVPVQSFGQATQAQDRQEGSNFLNPVARIQGWLARREETSAARRRAAEQARAAERERAAELPARNVDPNRWKT